MQSRRGKVVQVGVATLVFNLMRRKVRGRGQERRAEHVDVAPTGSIALMQGEETVVLLRFCGVRLILFCCIPILELLPKLKGMIWNTKPFLAHSVKPPHEGSRQRSCSAPNLRRSPRHSPAVPGVPSLVEMGEQEERSRSVFVWHMHTPHYIRGNSCSLKVAGWLEVSYFTPTRFLVVGLADSQMCMFAAVWRLCTFSKLNLERWS